MARASQARLAQGPRCGHNRPHRRRYALAFARLSVPGTRSSAAYANESLLPFDVLDIEFYNRVQSQGRQCHPGGRLAGWERGHRGMEFRRTSHVPLRFSARRGSATNWFVQPSFVPFVHQDRALAGRPPRMSGATSACRRYDSLPAPEGIVAHLEFTEGRPGKKSLRAACGRRHRDCMNFPMAKPASFMRSMFLPEESDLSPWANREQLAALESKEAARPDDSAFHTRGAVERRSR